MTRPTLSNLSGLSPQHQAQVRNELKSTPHPRTVQLVHADPLPFSPGKPAVRKVAKVPLPDVAAFFAVHGVYAPEPEFKFAHDRRWRFDYAWPARRIALEVEGGVWTNGRHTRGSGFVRDMEKYNRAAVLGWRVVRVVPSQLMTPATAEMLREMMKAEALL